MDPIEYLADASQRIYKIVSIPANKDKLCKHITKVIQEAERYQKYLLSELDKAKKAGLTSHDSNIDKNKWFFWTSRSNDAFTLQGRVYFEDYAQFYIEGQPAQDPLNYLVSMLWGAVGQPYDGLNLQDYQAVLLACIHDAQNWQAGRERIFFDPLKPKTLADRLCCAVWNRLKEYQESIYRVQNFRPIQETIEIAIDSVMAGLQAPETNQTETNKAIRTLDEVNQKIIKIYQEAAIRGIKPPSLKTIAKVLYTAKITPEEMSRETIRQRIKKLREAGLLDEPLNKKNTLSPDHISDKSESHKMRF